LQIYGDKILLHNCTSLLFETAIYRDSTLFELIECDFTYIIISNILNMQLIAHYLSPL